MHRTACLASFLLLSFFSPPILAQSVGPDLIVGRVGPGSPSIVGTLGGVAAVTFGSEAWNIGNQALGWVANTPNHPVMALNFYRLHQGRFVQLGQSWLKHGFVALQQGTPGGCTPFPNGTALGPGCASPCSSGVAASQVGLGPRSDVNPATGVFPYPPTSPPFGSVLDRRLQVATADLDVNLFPGARWFAEIQFVHPEDVAAGNDLNNASWREVSIIPTGTSFAMIWAAPTVQQQPAIHAWASIDPAVALVPVDVPGDGRLWVAWRSVAIGGGLSHHEIAVHNLGSARGLGALEVNLPCGATVSNLAFRDVDSHSGEPYSTQDWIGSVAPNGVVWMTQQTFAQNPDANALRWGTLYSFSFDSDQAPTSLTLVPFQPRAPRSVGVPMTGSTVEFQVNQPEASLAVNGVQGSALSLAVVNLAPGQTGTLAPTSTLTGQLWDLAYGTAAPIGVSACATVLLDGQVFNLDVGDPSFGLWWQGFQGPLFVNQSLVFTAAGPSAISLQMGVADPAATTGIRLSQPTRVIVP